MKFRQNTLTAVLLLSVSNVPSSQSRPWGTTFGPDSNAIINKITSSTNSYKSTRTNNLFLEVSRGGSSSPAVTESSTETATENAIETTTATDASAGDDVDDTSLEDKEAAMRRLGLSPPSEPEEDVKEETLASAEAGAECKDGACTLPALDENDNDVAVHPKVKEDIATMTKRISHEMGVDESIVLAALGATMMHGDEGRADEDRVNEEAAKDMIRYEIEAINRIKEDSDEVKQLVEEGYNPTLSRRALAFADMNIDDARAILQADEEDAKAEAEAEAKLQQEKEAAENEEAIRAKLREEASQNKEQAESEMKTVTVDANFDPTNPTGAAATPTFPSSFAPRQQQQQQGPPPAKKEDVVFEATSSTLQSIILESPVPVLLDVYADWCGPCKALTPVLETIAVKAGGMFRLVKLNTDEERPVSQALGVTSLPTVFAIKDGRVVNSFQGMPRDEEFMKNFMMGLLSPGYDGSQFTPPVDEERKKVYKEITNKLIKVAGAAGFSFSQREMLQDRTTTRLGQVVEKYDGDMADAEETAKIIRSLLSNVIRDPFEEKFRRINLNNKVIAARIAKFPSAISILKSVGFSSGGENTLILGKGKKVVNVAPCVVARDTIDKWIDRNRREIATAARRKRDEIAHAKLLEEAEEVGEDEYDEEDEEEEIDANLCSLKLRIEGKKKVHDISLQADDPLSSIIDALPTKVPEGEEIQITCTARRLIVKSSDSEAMRKSLREHNLVPSAVVVVKIGTQGTNASAETNNSNSSLKERAKARQARKKKEHTMQSVGIYSKDDNAKGELIDGGGGVWYEHDVSDEEGEEEDKDDEVADDGSGEGGATADEIEEDEEAEEGE